MTNTVIGDPKLIGDSKSNGKYRATSFDLILFTVPQSWDEGVGYDYEFTSYDDSLGNKIYDTRASNWYDRTTTSGWTNPGIYTGATILQTIHFDNGNEDIDEMLNDFRDAVLHEFNHMYEYYNRAVKGEKGLDTTLSFMKKPLEMIDTGLNEEVLSVWKQFLSLLYMSEPYEVRAMSQEAYSKRLRMPFEQFKTTKYWQYCQGMINFDANDYYEYILELIEDLPQEEQNTLLKTLHTYFIAYYEFSKIKPTSGKYQP